MRLAAIGWSRKVTWNDLGKPNLKSAKTGKPGSVIKKREDTFASKTDDESMLNIQWYAGLSLTGSYRVNLAVSKSDIGFMIRNLVGETLSLADLDEMGLRLSDEGLGEKIAGMQFGEVLEAVNGRPTPDPDPDPEEAEPPKRGIRFRL